MLLAHRARASERAREIESERDRERVGELTVQIFHPAAEKNLQAPFTQIFSNNAVITVLLYRTFFCCVIFPQARAQQLKLNEALELTHQLYWLY